LKMEKAPNEVNKMVWNPTLRVCIQGPKSKFDSSGEWISGGDSLVKEGATCEEFWGLKEQLKIKPGTEIDMDAHTQEPFCIEIPAEWGAAGLLQCHHNLTDVITYNFAGVKEAVDAQLLQKSAAVPAVPAFSWRACVAEFIAMTLFVWVGCGAAMSIAKKEGSAWVLQVSLAFGLAITVLAYTIGHWSGGHINGAVSISLVVSGKISIVQCVANIVAQLLGSVLGALILEFMYGAGNDCTGGLGTNGVAEGFSKTSALLGEVIGTFLLVYVVHETAVNPMSKGNSTLAPLAIGLSVFLAHCVLIPIDGCSINPTRSFGPALVCKITRKDATPFQDFWIFTVGPIIGALLAAGVYIGLGPMGW